MTRNDRPAILVLAVGLAFGLCAAAVAQVHLVHDFFPGEFEGDRPAPQLTPAGGALFFIAAELGRGHAVWRTDGTAAGTGRVEVPGDSGLLDAVRILGAMNGKALWTANAAANPGVTVLLAAGAGGGAATLYTGFVAGTPRILGQRLFFLGCSSTACTVWSSDGTRAGTAPVPALAARIPTGSVFDALAGRWLIFRSGTALLAYDAAQARVLPVLSTPYPVKIFPVGETLFVLTEGPGAGVWASHLGAAAARVFRGGEITVVGWRGDRLYFATKEGQLWSSDGSPEGTLPYSGLRVDRFSLLADQLGGIGPRTLIPMPGYYGAGLLAADDGTHEVKGILRACTGKYPCLGNRMSAVTVAGDHAFEVINGRLVRSDGTAQGTGYGSGLHAVDAASIGVVDGHLVLGAMGQGVQQLWETDGTAAGTTALSDGTRDRPFRVEGPPITYNGALFAAAERNPVGQQLWRIAGGRPAPLTDLRHLASGIEPSLATRVGDRVLLQGNAAYDGNYYGWIGVGADGSAEAVPNYDDSCAQGFSDVCTTPVLPVGGRLVYALGDQADLWSTDGTDAGTALVLDPDGNPLQAAALGPLGDRALILSLDGGLWSSDGSPSGGTALIARLPVNPAHPERFAPVFPPVALGGSSFLFRRGPGPQGPGSSVLEIWRTDGTAAGTLRLASTPYPDDYSAALSPAVVGGRLFFRFGGTLWTSDGSAAGTLPLPQQLPGGTFALAAGGTALYAAAGYQDADPNHETLWAIDPSTLAATRLGTFGQVSSGAVGASLGSVVGDTLFFGVTDPQDPQAVETVWRTSGTAASTHALPAPLASLTAAAFVTGGDRRYFTACEAAHGCELWSTDRLGESTALVADVWPGPRGSDPEILAVDGTSLLFAATEPTTGRELWRLDLPASTPPAAGGAKALPPALFSPRRAAPPSRRPN